MLAKTVWGLVVGALVTVSAVAENSAPVASPALNPTAVATPGGNPPPANATVKVEPYRTWVTIHRYVVESNGEPNNPVSNVRITVTFPNGTKIQLPDGGQWWPIGNGQAQEINRTFEVPFAYVSQRDGFKFQIQMERKGSKMLPCEFDVVQLSQFNRAYNCQTDVAWQTTNQQLSPEKIDKEGVQIRVFTSRNATPKEIPTDAIALK